MVSDLKEKVPVPAAGATGSATLTSAMLMQVVWQGCLFLAYCSWLVLGRWGQRIANIVVAIVVVVVE